MKRKNLENELRNLKFIHLSESDLVAYCDEESDQIRRVRMEAHLKQCFICERQLELLRKESAALKNRQITDEDIALVDQMIQLAQKSAVAETKEASLQERLTEYLRQVVESWRASFMKEATRGSHRKAVQREEIWQWQSKDGRLQVRATMEKNADLTIHFSSNEIDLDGARLNIHLGKLSQEITLERVSESEVYAKVAVPRQYRRKGIADIFIESI
ncbi:MAG TPA: hypothetical protein VLR90_00655 [Blastocatellia bacterium]|nr:hypothetical protein [Blastocatellia bacterium]